MNAPSRQRLGTLLVQAGLLTQAQLDQTLELQKHDRRRLGALLVDQGLVTSARLTQMLSHQLGLPWVSPSHVSFSPELIERIPRDVALRHCVLPVYLQRGDGERVLYVAMEDPTSEEALADCARVAGMRIRPMVAAPEHIRAAIRAHYDGISEPPPSAVQGVTGAMRVAASVLPPPPQPLLPPSPAPPLVEPVSLPAEPDPVVLVAGGSPRFLELCGEAASALPARVENAELADLKQKARTLRPIAIVLTEDLYAFDRVAFNKLALAQRAALVIWSDDLEAEYLEPVLVAAQQRSRG